MSNTERTQRRRERLREERAVQDEITRRYFGGRPPPASPQEAAPVGSGAAYFLEWRLVVRHNDYVRRIDIIDIRLDQTYSVPRRRK